MAKVHFVTLGCPKNRVDAEHMLGLSQKDGHELCDDVSQADAIVVNTCSFIDSAKEESVNTILEMANIKEDTGAKLLVTGCLAQRYGDAIAESIPEIDGLLGTADYSRLPEMISKVHALAPIENAKGGEAKKAKNSLPIVSSGGDVEQSNWVSDELQFVAGCDMPRTNTMPQYTAYLKIAEGCDNTCAFCIIPKLRGKQRSRPIADLVSEAKRLAKGGVQELNLIAQDLTGYGHDLEGKPTLAQLLHELGRVEGLKWVRCMYAYPRSLSKDLRNELATNPRVLPYFDIPTQHGSDRMLRRMRRGRDQTKLKKLLTSLREDVPNIVLRSTVIVGFPGENEEDFNQLEDFAETLRFERLGVFKYSDEEDTTAFELDSKCEQNDIDDRYDRLMQRQQRIHESHLEDLLGTYHEAVVERESEEYPGLMIGRLWSQAPEIDGQTYFSSENPLAIGDFVTVKIDQVHAYDVVGEVVENVDENQVLPFGVRDR